MMSSEKSFLLTRLTSFKDKSDCASDNIPNDNFKCKICNKPYNHNAFAKHDVCECDKQSYENDSLVKRPQCNTCGQKFRFIKALIKHEARHQGKGGFICRTCGASFVTVEDREKHREKDHKVLRCRICNIKFKEETEYFSHINNLHEGRDRELLMCSECGKQFKTKSELSHHVSSKCGTVKKYECTVCFQTLMTPGSLHNHMLRHTGQRTYMCRFCAKTFLTAGQLTVHERIHTQEKAFVCDICNKGFCHRQSLITHSTLHTGIKPYVCENCGNAFSCVGNLLKHRKTHADSCGKIPLTTHRVKHPATKMKVQANTPPASKLKLLEKRKKIQQITDNPSEPWILGTNVDNNYYNEVPVMENANVPTNYEYGENINDKIVEMPYQSEPTLITNTYMLPQNLVDSNETKLNDNKSTTENPTTPLTSNIELTDKPIETDNDKNSLDVKDDYEEEWADDNRDFESSSEISNDSVDLFTRKMKQMSKKYKSKLSKEKTKESKKRRRSTVDRDELQKFVEERGLVDQKKANCQYCGCVYNNMLWLMKHEQKHMQSNNDADAKGSYKCSCCDSTFQSKDDRSDHQQLIHADILTCKECDRIFANPDSIKAHMNFYHKGVTRKVYLYVCEKCGRVFKQKALLLGHKQSNCGEGPIFKCDICEKKFASKHVLKSHMRVHLTEKSLLCKFCGKSFHWKGQLKIHERSHTGERPFQCQYCPKSFSYRESLITHSTIHTGIKPHLCEACGSRFSCIGNLLKHRRTHATTCGMITRIKNELMS